MQEIKHVFFDLDHTLWDFEKNSDLTFERIFKEHNIKIDLAIFLSIYKPLNREFWRMYREEKISKKELRYQRLKTAFDRVNYSVSDDTINQMAIDYIEYLPKFNNLFEYTLEILEYLKDKYKLHIITNGFEEVQTKKMTSSNILKYFDKVITSESVGVKKPNPKVFHYALEITSATSSNSIMIGDSVEADIYGALNVGMQVLHCNFENEDINTNDFKSINSLKEIKQYL